MNYEPLIESIRAGARELPFESAIRSAVVIRRLGADLPASESVPGLSAAQCALEAVRRTIADSHEVRPIADRWRDRQLFVFYRHVTEGRRRWNFEVEVEIDPAVADGELGQAQRAVIADARVTHPEAQAPEAWQPGPALPVGMLACPCCGYATLSVRGCHEVCPVCFWEDDGQDNDDLDRRRGGTNGVSLREGRINFARFGASVEADCECVRRPTDEEVRLRRFDGRGREIIER